MLFWWVTLFTSVKPLMNLLTRALYAGTILYLTQDNNNTAMEQQQQREKEQLYANNVVTTLHNQEFTTAKTTTKSASTEYWPFSDGDRDASTEWEHDVSFFSDSVFDSVEDAGVDMPPKSIVPLSLIEGIYKYEKSFNFNEYLKELGVSYMLRTFAGLATPIITITKNRPESTAPDGDPESFKWTIRTDTLFKSHEVSFHLGEWTKDVTMDGRSIRFKVVVGEGENRHNRLTEVQEVSGGGGKGGKKKKTTTLVRDFTPEGMSVTLTVNNVISTSFFSRMSKGEEGRSRQN